MFVFASPVSAQLVSGLGIPPGDDGRAAQHFRCGDALPLQAPLDELQEAGEL